MNTPESVDLKLQLKEMLDKGYFRPNVSPWGAPLLLPYRFRMRRLPGWQHSDSCQPYACAAHELWAGDAIGRDAHAARGSGRTSGCGPARRVRVLGLNRSAPALQRRPAPPRRALAAVRLQRCGQCGPGGAAISGLCTLRGAVLWRLRRVCGPWPDGGVPRLPCACCEPS